MPSCCQREENKYLQAEVSWVTERARRFGGAACIPPESRPQWPWTWSPTATVAGRLVLSSAAATHHLTPEWRRVMVFCSVTCVCEDLPPHTLAWGHPKTCCGNPLSTLDVRVMPVQPSMRRVLVLMLESFVPREDLSVTEI